MPAMYSRSNLLKETGGRGPGKALRLLGIILAACLASACATDLYVEKNDYAYAVPQEFRPPPPVPGSVWTGLNANNTFFADKKARNINDVVTILITETSTGENNAKIDTTRDSTIAAGIAGFTQTAPDKTMISRFDLGGSHRNNLKGEGKTSRNSNLTATLTARVISVMDNGNLVIQGRRQLSVNAEDQYIILTGVIRPEDITSDNTVSSRFVADARIVYGGRGVVNDKMRPGWLARVLDWAWPF